MLTLESDRDGRRPEVKRTSLDTSEIRRFTPKRTPTPSTVFDQTPLSTTSHQSE